MAEHLWMGWRRWATASLMVSSLWLSTPLSAAERVIALAPHLAELVCAAGGCDRLVAVGAFTDYPPQAAALPEVGDVYRVSLESLVAHRPDLVLVWDGGTPSEHRQRLRRLGVPVESLRIEGLDDIAPVLRELGRRLGDPMVAEAAAQAYEARLSALRQRYAGSPRLRLMYLVDVDPLYTLSGRSPVSEALAVCGGDNVFADLPQLAPPLSREALLQTPMDAVVHGERDTRVVQAFWARLPWSATRRPPLVAADGHRLVRSSPRLLEALEPLCEALDRLRPASAG